MNNVSFKAQIKSLATRELVSGDSMTRIELEVDNISLLVLNDLAGVRHCNKNKSKELQVVISE